MPGRVIGIPRASELDALPAHPPAWMQRELPVGLVQDRSRGSRALREGQAGAEPPRVAPAPSPPAQPGQPQYRSGRFPKVLSTIPGLSVSFLPRSLPPLNFSPAFQFSSLPRPPIPVAELLTPPGVSAKQSSQQGGGQNPTGEGEGDTDWAGLRRDTARERAKKL